MSEPLISVVMPAYNGERYLAAAVESVLGQEFGDFELLVTDDGSTDRTYEILLDYARQDARVKVNRQEHGGLCSILNAGILRARGALVARMDADDIAMPKRFSLQVKYLREHPECVAVGGRILLIDDEGLPICEMCEQTTHEEIDEFNLRAGGAAMNHPSVMYRAEAVRKVGGYRPEIYPAEDLDLWLRMAEVGRLANLPQVLTRYRVHANSISHAKRNDQQAKWRAVVDEARRRRGLPRDSASEQPVEEQPATAGDHHRRWAWVALMNGHVKTARKHAMSTFRLQPFSIESWRLAYCAIRGH